MAQEPRPNKRYLQSSFGAFVSFIHSAKLDDGETTGWTDKHLLNNLPGLSTGLGEREGSKIFLAPLTSLTNFSGLVGRRAFSSRRGLIWMRVVGT